jgi:hypothetical protein
MTFFLWRPFVFAAVNPVIGIGAGHTEYHYSKSIIVDASESYAVLFLGVNIVRNRLDIMLTLPLPDELQTTFESKLYSIRPTGPGVSILVSM